MLSAQKAQLQTALQVNLLSITEKELSYHVSNCLSIGLQAAIIASFSYNGVVEVTLHEADDWIIGLVRRTLP